MHSTGEEQDADLTPWWHDAVFYQIYMRSFADSNGDGVGDIEGIRSRLGYLELLGVDAIWLTPFYRSPMADHGYDVADPRDVDPLFGNLESFDQLVADVHEHGLKLTVDLVPNHTSDQHVWFQEALASPPGSAARDRYIFRDGQGMHGELPPNNWTSVFGGPAWQQVPDGQWYLHIFAPEQPDLNWRNPQVQADLEYTLRFWLERGVDGFRIDVAHGMAKPENLPDMDPRLLNIDGMTAFGMNIRDPRFDDDGVHEVHRLIRRVLDQYPGTMAVGEIWVGNDDRFADYLRPDELHLGFNFHLVDAQFDADSVREAISHSLGAVAKVGAQPTWTLSNHDVMRHPTRYGGGPIGTVRARAMTLVELALPGVVYLYNGEELGLPNLELPDWALQDPIWERSGHAERGRDGARVPMPWEGARAPFGFNENGAQPWLPMPDDWESLTVEAQLEDEGSMLSLYRQALEVRRTSSAFAGDELEWYGAPPGCFAFRRKGGGLICALNTSAAAVPLPPGDVLIASGPLDGTKLPPDTSVWLV